MHATAIHRLLYLAACAIAWNTSTHAALGPQWHETYNRAFILLEQNPVANQHTIRQLSAELTNISKKLKVADFITRSQDPLDALDAYQLLQDPTAAHIKEIERRVRVYNLQRRKRLVAYIQGLLKNQPLPTIIQEQPDIKLQPTKKPPIKKQPIATKPSIPPLEPKPPVSIQPAPERIPEIEVTTPAIPAVEIPPVKPIEVVASSTEQRAAQIKSSLKRLDQLEEDDYASLISMINTQARSEYALDTIVRKLQRTIDEMLAQEVESPIATEQEGPTIDHPAIQAPSVSPSSVQPLIEEEPKEISEEIEKITVQPKVKPKKELVPIAEPLQPTIQESEPMHIVPEKPIQQPALELPAESIITQPERPALPASTQQPTALITLPSLEVLAQNPQKYFQDVGTFLHQENTQLQELVATHPGDKNLALVAPELQTIIALQSNLVAYFILNPDIAHAVAQHPEIIGHILAGQEPTKQDQALIATGIPVSQEQLQELDKLIRDLRKQQEKIKKAAQQHPKIAQAVVTTYPSLPSAQTLTQYLQQATEELAKPTKKTPVIIEEVIEAELPPAELQEQPAVVTHKPPKISPAKQAAQQETVIQESGKQPTQSKPVKTAAEEESIRQYGDTIQKLKTHIAALKENIDKDLQEVPINDNAYKDFLAQLSAALDPEKLPNTEGELQRTLKKIY